ncbi:HAD family hydrolase [Streptomyces spongiae]|uniref:HAD family hydrolase n=1 Tax=Streptomyces spongiae TaxID=565072 RepID=A0A5N8XI57_9ACTN|nr:HAD family hydrolase [Streptomyces spongiae]MPY58934.1 HAD family hydrolase [Streptomyces spongiae]
MSTAQPRATAPIPAPLPEPAARLPRSTPPHTPALLLDSGGVLILPDGAVLSHYGKRLGLRLDPVTARHAVALAARDLDLAAGPDTGPHAFAHRWSAHAGCSPDAAESLWRTVRREVDDTVLWSVVNPEAVPFLDALPPQVQRYVVSNADGRAHAELARAGLLDRLDGVLDSAAVGIAKPDPRIFRMAAVALGRPLEQCRYVGDTLDGAPHGLPPTVLYDPLDIYPDDAARYTRIRRLSQLLNSEP